VTITVESKANCATEMDMGSFYNNFQTQPMMLSQGPNPTGPTHHSTIILAKATYFD